MHRAAIGVNRCSSRCSKAIVFEIINAVSIFIDQATININIAKGHSFRAKVVQVIDAVVVGIHWPRLIRFVGRIIGIVLSIVAINVSNTIAIDVEATEVVVNGGISCFNWTMICKYSPIDKLTRPHKQSS